LSVASDGVADIAVPDVVVLGGLESVGQGRINVMGQQFDSSALGLDEQGLKLRTGQRVYVEAKNGSDLPIATMVRAFDDLSIPGASPVFIRGSVTSVDKGVGQIRLGSLRVDLNNVEGDAPAVGDVLAVSGTQPSPSGLILGDARF
jgi:hypothetical protein